MILIAMLVSGLIVWWITAPARKLAAVAADYIEECEKTERDVLRSHLTPDQRQAAYDRSWKL